MYECYIYKLTIIVFFQIFFTFFKFSSGILQHWLIHNPNCPHKDCRQRTSLLSNELPQTQLNHRNQGKKGLLLKFAVLISLCKKTSTTSLFLFLNQSFTKSKLLGFNPEVSGSKASYLALSYQRLKNLSFLADTN